MPYTFNDYDEEFEPQASASRGGSPPRKVTTAGVLDPPVPPRRPRWPLASIPAKWWLRAFAGAVLVAVVITTILLIFAPR